MKKSFKFIISLILIISLVFLTVTPFWAVEIKRYYGDIDNDSYVTTQDARIALMVAAGIYDEDLVGMDYEAADMDDDYEITTVDARLILRTAAGLVEKRQMEGYEFDESPEKFLDKVNELRYKEDSSAKALKLSTELCDAAREAAEEYATKTGTALVREDGSYYYKLLNEKGINYTCADKIIATSSFGYKETFKQISADLQSKKALCSDNFTKFGVGAYTKDGHTFYWCIFLIK